MQPAEYRQKRCPHGFVDARQCEPCTEISSLREEIATLRASLGEPVAWGAFHESGRAVIYQDRATQGPMYLPVRPLVWARKDQLQQANMGGGFLCAMYPDTQARNDLEPLYSAKAMREMIGEAWVAGYYEAGYTNDGDYADKKSDEFVSAVMGANAMLTVAKPTVELPICGTATKEK